jgi:hypothetical protein
MTAVDSLFEALPEERKAPMKLLFSTMKKHMPKGFEAAISSGMASFVVPLSTYPKGYHCAANMPLPFISVASQKNFIAIYHMGLYADPKLLQWFTDEYAKRVPGKLDMGKSCIRFKKPDQIPLDLIGELCSKVTPAQWIETYEKAFRK